jgi:hypothetical protein
LKFNLKLSQVQARPFSQSCNKAFFYGQKWRFRVFPKVTDSKILLAYWDGRPKKQVVSQAEMIGRTVLVLNTQHYAN